MSYKINSIDDLKELKKNNFHAEKLMHIIRGFILTTEEEVVYLITNYLPNFAFSIKYGGSEFAIIKEGENIFVRNNNKYNFEFPDCPPPVSSAYCLKVIDANQVINLIIKEG